MKWKEVCQKRESEGGNKRKVNSEGVGRKQMEKREAKMQAKNEGT